MPTHGHRHPIPAMIAEMNTIFSQLGFVYADGPEVETEQYNFDRLNVPADHPSRDMQDTFWLRADDVPEPSVLRTHTSPVQIRYLETHEPPVRMIAPGKVFRNEATDATHEAQFFQIEGLYVDRGVHMGHLKGVLSHFFAQFFGEQVAVRFRPGYFPFVEPGVEVDFMLPASHGSALAGRWIEGVGAGMVHPTVLEGAGVDPEVYTGFAFGVGVDRLAIMKYGIPDIRMLYTGDLRVVSQF